MQSVRFINVSQAPQRKPPTAIEYEMWNEGTHEWDKYNSVGEAVYEAKNLP